jgi:ketosteroid isomerase-like protein
MSQENVEIVRSAYDALNRRGDWGWALRHVHPDCVCTFHAGPNAGTHRGLEEIRAVFEDATAGFDAWIQEPVKFYESGDRVVVVVRHRLRPKGGSGGEFEFRNSAIWTVRDGAIVSLEGFPSPAEALEAVGLSE